MGTDFSGFCIVGNNLANFPFFIENEKKKKKKKNERKKTRSKMSKQFSRR